MRLNKKELKKIQYDFNSISNRLLQTDFNDYTDVLGKFLNFVDSVPLINDYIVGCGNCDMDIENEVKEVRFSYGDCIFSVGDTDEEEIRNVSAILHYLVEINEPIYRFVAWGYSSSDNYQDKIKGFNDRFVMVLIRHIERYLTKVGIDMGIDDRVTYNVTVQNGQAIIATDSATVTATNNVGINTDELNKLIAAVKDNVASLPSEDQTTVADCLETIEAEAMSPKPEKRFLRTALTALKTIKGAAEFGAAVAALVEFVSPLV